ncbi:hypothetical protein H0H92_003452 [Tricholoma furcatifolium]|nr:hypothetical protein H0H92_003452 [Tricholoma furcatifolium]
MIISSSLSIGQITFILRIAVQILTYAGLAIVGVLILTNIPRVASLTTHDALNRIVGASTSTTSTLKWLLASLRHNPAETAPSTKMILLLFLSISYTIFVSLSDIGFLGFHACSVAGPTTYDTPGSVNSSDIALSLIAANTVNGTDLSRVRTYRCDASALTQFPGGNIEYNCTAWRNSTLADEKFYAQLNSTDSDVLMPRQLAYSPFSNDSTFDYNSFNIGPTSQLVDQPIIYNGLAIVPQSTGAIMIAGVPQLQPNTRIDLTGALAVEVEVGCMTLGVVAFKGTYDVDLGNDYMFTNGTWRQYSGPGYMEDLLNQTVDSIRAYLYPFFNPSTIDSTGAITSINSTNVVLSAAANVQNHYLPYQGSDIGPDDQFMGNCTAALYRQLGIPAVQYTLGNLPGQMCSLLGIGGTRSANGISTEGFERMICAASTQVNLVTATIQVDGAHNVSANITRLPSTLTYTTADFWDTMEGDNGTVLFVPYMPYERYTLSPDNNAPTSHYIPQKDILLTSSQSGQGSAGNAISSLIPIVLDLYGQALGSPDYAGLTFLPEGFNYVDTSPDRMASWVGQVSGSYFLGSLGYNGWAALQATVVEVVSTGGYAAVCYKPYYALGFLPLVLAAVVFIFWTGFLFWSRLLFFSTEKVKDAYGGISTYSTAITPNTMSSDALIAWESTPHPHLQPVSDEYPLAISSKVTALAYLKEASSNHP